MDLLKKSLVVIESLVNKRKTQLNKIKGLMRKIEELDSQVDEFESIKKLENA